MLSRTEFALLSSAAVLGAFAVLVNPAAGEASSDLEQRASESRKLIKSFAGKLKGELVGAIKQGGPKSAIPVCQAAAPAIAREKSAEKGWSVGRTALRLRNPSNAPDDWELGVLQDFQERADEGADLSKLEHYAVVERDGAKVFRYMKAIPMGKPCLTCHGPDVDAELYETIKSHYPQDEATGFELGDLRGAFTITQPMD